jgi:hypothetical protein
VQPDVAIRVGRVQNDRIDAHPNDPAGFVCGIEDRADEIRRGQNAPVRHRDAELSSSDFK